MLTFCTHHASDPNNAYTGGGYFVGKAVGHTTNKHATINLNSRGFPTMQPNNIR
jgi:hypothetical protein